MISLIPVIALTVVSLAAADAKSAPCLMQPELHSIVFPARGFHWLPGEESIGACDAVPTEGWIRKRSGRGEIGVNLEGPQGSGRYWNVTIAESAGAGSAFDHGICVSASTVGWRTLQHYSQGALPWLDDVDGDGKAELLLWSSFPLNEHATMAEHALVAWVFRLDGPNSFALDLDLSRIMARELVKEYRLPIKSDAPFLAGLRTEAAEALEKFATGQCALSDVGG